MRLAVVTVFAAFGLVACSSAPPPKPPAAPPPKCAKVADHMIELMTPDAQSASADSLDAMRKLFNDHCRDDGWSVAAQDCVLAAGSRNELAEKCGNLFSEEQGKALVGEAKSWSSDETPSDAGAVDAKI